MSARRFALTLALGVVALLGAEARPAEAATPNAGRSVYVNLFEWKWTDVARECETYLGPRGFGGVQVSPPNEHARISGNPWWQRYQPVSYQLTSRSGTRAQFQEMTNRCRAVGVEVYSDVVINHMAAGSGTGWAGTAFSSRSFPGTYGPPDFHWNAPAPNGCQAQISNYNDRFNVQQCELVGLADLYTESDYVRGRIAAYLIDLYNLGARGYRVDAAKHMKATDLANIVSRLNAGRASGPAPYVVQEVIDPGTEAVRKTEYYGTGDVNEFLYGRNLADRFRNVGGNISQLQTFGESWGLAPSSEASVFVDNHDTQRGGLGSSLTYKDGALYTLANVFMLAWPYGYPQLMSSYSFTNNDAGPPSDGSGNTNSIYESAIDPTPNCFAAWVCEHRWLGIGNMVAFRNAVGSSAVNNWWSNGSNQIAFGRGTAGYVIVNRASSSLSRAFQTSLPAGTYCDVAAGDFTGSACTGRTLGVTSTGSLTATVAPTTAAALHVGARLSGSPPPPPPPPGGVTTTFNENATTVVGQNVFVVGNVAQLGAWNTGNAIPLSSAGYPVWSRTVTLPPSTAIQYKYIKRNGAGTVVWESGANRTFTTPSSGSVTRNDTWK